MGPKSITLSLENADLVLYKTYVSVMKLAADHQIQNIAFCPISSGNFRGHQKRDKIFAIALFALCHVRFNSQWTPNICLYLYKSSLETAKSEYNDLLTLAGMFVSTHYSFYYAFLINCGLKHVLYYHIESHQKVQRNYFCTLIYHKLNERYPALMKIDTMVSLGDITFKSTGTGHP